MISLLLAFAPQAGPAADAPGTLAPLREVSWEEFCRDHFRPEWSLPMPTTKEAGKVPIDLVAWFQDFATRDLTLAEAQKAPEGHQPFLLGDLIAEMAPFREDCDRLRKTLRARAAELPGLNVQERRNLEELLCDAGLFRKNWTPEDNRKDDGILHLPTWEFKEDKTRSEPWKSRRGDDTVQRGAVLLFADLETWFRNENDVEGYFDHAANRFEQVEIPPRTRVRAIDPNGVEHRAQTFRVNSDLPFPFGKYGGDNRVRLTVRPDGLVVNEVYLASNDDFYWLAGRDVFLPLKTADGRFICHLIIQEFGFDLDGVPESDGNRKEAVRSALGNKKRMTELLFRPRAKLAPQTGQLPPDASTWQAADASARD